MGRQLTARSCLSLHALLTSASMSRANLPASCVEGTDFQKKNMDKHFEVQKLGKASWRCFGWELQHGAVMVHLRSDGASAGNRVSLVLFPVLFLPTRLAMCSPEEVESERQVDAVSKCVRKSKPLEKHYISLIFIEICLITCIQ